MAGFRRSNGRKETHTLRVLGATVVAVLALEGCDRKSSDARRDSTPQAARASDDTTPSRLVALGDAILIPGDSAGRFRLMASSAVPRLDTPISLIAPDGQLTAARIVAIDPDSGTGCRVVSVAPTSESATVGIIGSPRPLAAMPLAAVSRTDSTELSRRVLEIASVLPGDTAGRFSGLPFRIVSLWRIQADSNAVIVATLQRQIPQEADPMEERTFLVATQDATRSWTLRYSERATGPEETIESVEFLAAVAGPSAPIILVARDYGDETVVSALGSATPTSWRTTWSSPRRGC